MRIIFATTNEGKMREIRMIMADLGVEILSMKEAGCSLDIVEDGNSFEENSTIKARAVLALSNDIVLADDSGLEVDYQQGAGNILCKIFRGGYAVQR